MKPIVISCDWFAFCIRSTRPKPTRLPEGFEEEVLDGTKVFKRRAIYRYKGSKVLTVLSQPKSKVLRKDLIQIEVANRWLYDVANIEGIIGVMFPTYILNNIGRVDICADFEVDKEKQDVITHLADGSYYVGGKQGIVVWCDETKERHPYCFNFGKGGGMKSDVKWKLYNKSKEIAATTQHCTKSYIRNLWQQNDLDISKVWRLEVSFHGEKFSDGNGNKVTLKSIYNRLLQRVIFAEMYKFRFVVKERGHTRKANDREVEFLSLTELNQPYIQRQREVIKGRYDDEQDARLLLNRLVSSWVTQKTLSDGVNANLYELIVQICEEYGYYGYVEEKFGVSFREQSPRKVLRG